MHPIVELAKRTVEEYTKTGRETEPPSELDGVMARKAGVFVCLKKHGQLRGCIGSIEPVTENVAKEVIKNAIFAAAQDPRFFSIQEDELGHLEYTVDVLTTPEPVIDRRDLDPKRYGVIVKQSRRRGLLLPDLEGVNTVEEQLSIAMSKAGIDPDEENVTIERFEVIRYK